MSENNPISKLDAHESWALIGSVRLGRVSSPGSETPDIHPVSYIVRAGKIYFRTAKDSRLSRETVGFDVAFEAAWQEADHAWSVVALGTARAVEPTERDVLDEMPILDFAPTIDDLWVEITPNELRGRRFNLI